MYRMTYTQMIWQTQNARVTVRYPL